MIKKKALIVAAAIMVSAQIGSISPAAVPPPEKMQLLQQYIQADDFYALRKFLLENPEFLNSAGPLAELLRAFMERGFRLSELFGFVEPTLPEALKSLANSPNAIY